MKRMISFLLSLCLLVSLTAVPVSAATTPRFTDVPADAWYAKAVDYVQEAGLFAGKGDGIFDPDGSMNRAMMAQVLASATENYRSGVYSADIMPYSDVDDLGSYAGEAISWLELSGIVTGFDDNTLRPKDNVTLTDVYDFLAQFDLGDETVAP